MRILLTGAHGFLGKHIHQILLERKYTVIAPTHEQMDLMDKNFVDWVLRKNQMDAVIHLAALCGENKKRPAEFFYNNLIMGVELMNSAYVNNVGKFVSVGTVCSYPKHALCPFQERDLWNGYPESTNAPYGLAKKMMLVQAQAYREQYGFNAIHVIPVNLYGPGDNFDLESSHVIPAIIRKMDDAKEKKLDHIELWGSGEVTREFLYVEDCARGICDALEKYNQPEPMNLGTGDSIRIDNLASMIKELIKFEGGISWNTDKPDGQPKRQLDISWARKCIDWKPLVDLKQGLKTTIEWWRTDGKDSDTRTGHNQKS